MRCWGRMLVVAAAALPAGAASAGEEPLYRPAPEWVTPVKLPDMASAPNGLLVLDIQQRVDGPTVWAFSDTAVKIGTPEELSQSSNIVLPWSPDKGDLIIHQLVILRDGTEIDALANGQKFTVLRREQALEQRELTGILSAALAVEGLRVGDTLRLRMSTTSKDAALGGRSQLAVPLLAEPVRVASASYRLSWRKDEPLKWQALTGGVDAAPRRNGDFMELPIALPLAKQPEMPDDAPIRYRRPPMVEASTFTGWDDVSKVMAPLYATEGTIADGSPIAAEVERIMAATDDPLRRTAMALQLVQDKVRYLAVGMDGGNYVPQTPAKTWDARYGDCKAKTLLLLAMLHAMEIDAEPVMAHAQLGDAIPSRIPSVLAFNHILVRAHVGGRALWLDGTALGTRLPDLGDPPPFGHVLPVRAAGAELERIDARPPARPIVDLALDADESTSVNLPSVMTVDMTLRGQLASLLTLASSQLGAKESRDLTQRLLQEYVGEAQFEDVTVTPAVEDGSVSIRARGVFGSAWDRVDKRTERWLARIPDIVAFAPDRARAAWAEIPVATPGPDRARYRLRIRLPDGGRGYRIEGEGALDGRYGGYEVQRSVTLADGIVTVDETLATSGIEIPAAQVAGERDRVATMLGQAPRMIAPEDARRRWNLAGAASTSQLDAIKAIYAANAAKADEENITALTSATSFQRGIGDFKAAEAMLTRQIALLPSVDAYLERSAVRKELGNSTGAIADAEEARKLDPSSASAISSLAWLVAAQGDVDRAARLLDERIALGGKARDDFRFAKAAMVGEFGEAQAAIDAFDALIGEKPGSPALLNARCWVKATRNVAIDTALKDCTSAIELSESTANILDSRALVWMRLGRDEDALRDLDAALSQIPALASSRLLRAIVNKRLGHGERAAADLAVARQLSPALERDYARFGLKP